VPDKSKSQLKGALSERRAARHKLANFAQRDSSSRRPVRRRVELALATLVTPRVDACRAQRYSSLMDVQFLSSPACSTVPIGISSFLLIIWALCNCTSGR
jgi:hypothetical protein